MDTQVEFHTGVADELSFACRLLRKAYHKGARVLVRAPAARLARLDRELWTFVEREFVPHLRFAGREAPPAQAARSPIWLVDGDWPAEHPSVLVNLGAEAPPDPRRFARIIEVLPRDPDEEQRGRERWRQYRAQGFEVRHHAAGQTDG